MNYCGEPDFRHDAPGGIGVLLVNLGTPEAPTAAALRRYLAEFLADPRVVEAPRWLWWLALHGVILRIRPSRAAQAYAKVWTDEGSPLLVISKRQRDALQHALDERLDAPVQVALGMRYGRPSIGEALTELRDHGVRRLLVLPLYPQYSATTTASTFDAVSRVLQGWRWLPDLRFVTHYHDRPDYIAALAASISERRNGEWRDSPLLFSFHGLPKRYFLAGDPYFCQCQATARLVAERLQLPDDRWRVAFQSRFGREEWLQPYADQVLKEMARDGAGRVQVVCPGFSADCLETLEETDQKNRALFLEHGGRHFDYVPALNDRADHIAALAGLVMDHAQGWPETAPDWNPEADGVERRARLERARAMGAKQ